MISPTLLAVRKKIAAERDGCGADRLARERAHAHDGADRRPAEEAGRARESARGRTPARARARPEGRQSQRFDRKARAGARLRATRAARASARSAAGLGRCLARSRPADAGGGFLSLHGKVPLPVNGIKIKVYGAPDGLGGTEKGVSIATRAGAQVTAPADGWVVYAGPFRYYGQLLILNAGGGYHIVLAGMDRISVELGQFVLTGEPVAVMGNGSHLAAILATGSSQPVLYVEFRKDGTPVDPRPMVGGKRRRKGSRMICARHLSYFSARRQARR